MEENGADTKAKEATQGLNSTGRLHVCCCFSININLVRKVTYIILVYQNIFRICNSKSKYSNSSSIVGRHNSFLDISISSSMQESPAMKLQTPFVCVHRSLKKEGREQRVICDLSVQQTRESSNICSCTQTGLRHMRLPPQTLSLEGSLR